MVGHSRLLGGMSLFGHICMKDRNDKNDRIDNVRWPVKLHLILCNSEFGPYSQRTADYNYKYYFYTAITSHSPCDISNLEDRK